VQKSIIGPLFFHLSKKKKSKELIKNIDAKTNLGHPQKLSITTITYRFGESCFSEKL
jgi:hypothetical protein